MYKSGLNRIIKTQEKGFLYLKVRVEQESKLVLPNDFPVNLSTDFL